jgi:hypothetical protein
MSCRVLFLASLSVLAIGCNEYELVNENEMQGDLGEDGDPDISVDPTQVDFAQVEVKINDSNEYINSVTQIVNINNEGDVDLHIGKIELATADGPFDLGALSSVLVPPGNSAQFSVTFTPETAVLSEGEVLIESDDPDEPTLAVPLLGEGIAPIIDVTPTDYDFGTLFIGCEGLQPVTITNTGNADLVISSLEYSTASATDFGFDDGTDTQGPLPWTLTASESAEVFISYAPYDEYADAAYLSIDSNDPYTPSVTVKQEGMGELYGTNLDAYEQPLKGMTDIILAVDRSCSMDDNIINVQNNFDIFITAMVDLDADYHVAATVEDNGCINGSDIWIDNTFTASDAQDTITAQINLGMSYGSNTERAFMMLESTLAEAVVSGGCNDGLIREDARLNLVGVSDEPEQSVNNYADYVSLFQSLKNDPDDVVMHAIGGDYPNGCASADAYTGFYEATVATGGLFLSICATDFGSHLEALAEGSTADLSSFELTEWPVPSTVIVKLDGVTTTVGWDYNPTDNAIDFDSDYVPEGGSAIEIEYALYGDCDE